MTNKQEARLAAESVVKIRQLLVEWLRSSKDSREPVAEILLLLEPLDALVRNVETGTAETPNAIAGSRDAGGTTYTIDKKRNENEVLTEHREGATSQPYRCPHYVYNDVVELVAAADPALSFEDLMDVVRKKPYEVPEWQVRVVLRFLINAQPPLLVKERNKYRGIRPSKLVGEATAAWKALAKASKRGR